MNDNDTILATITPSTPRRILGVSVLSILGGLLLYLGLARPPEHFGWQVFLVVLGGVNFYLADALRRATMHRIELTSQELRDTSGFVLARVDQIVAIERGAFAIKPSNGFMLRLKTTPEGGNAWAPGLWWRLGRRIGVGGITSATEAKTVAEYLAALVVGQNLNDE